MRPRWLALGLAAAIAVAGCTNDDPSPSAGTALSITEGQTRDGPPLAPLFVDTNGRPAIVDDLGREVLLRGVNLSSLGDYGENLPGEDPALPVTDDDWDAMANHGFSVVRLIVSWSALEPERDQIDESYLAEIHDAVDAAAARGIYTVIDMHQDAWSRFGATPPGTTCPPGTAPALAWDGAPAWATLSGDASTCTQGVREASLAVASAWGAFYSDHEGIRTELAELWGRLSEEFADDPAVAGYDLLNEPGFTPAVEADLQGLAAFYTDAIAAIRAAEVAPPGHIIFFEPTVAGQPVAPGFTRDRNLVFAPHNYGESITDLPIEVVASAFAAVGRDYGTPVWIGEYGWFEDTADSRERLGRYAQLEDETLGAGSAWWQWRQACGDPHSVGTPGGTPTDQIHFRRNGCPGDVDDGVVEGWACVWRGYPRAAPGRLRSLASDCEQGLDVAGTGERGDLELWVPDHGLGQPVINGTGSRLAVIDAVDGGWFVTVPVNGHYHVVVAASD